MFAQSSLVRQSNLAGSLRRTSNHICKGGLTMQNKTTTGTPFQKIQDACATTGLSRYFLRNGCKDGSIPHIKSGGVYYINIPALLKKLEATQ